MKLRSCPATYHFFTIALLSSPLTATSETAVSCADKAPTTWVLIRHADKLRTVMPDGTVNQSHTLSPKGVNRSFALVEYILGRGSSPRPFPQPDYIFAQAPKHAADPHSYSSAARPLQTVLPLAFALQGDRPRNTVVTTFHHPDKRPDLMALHVLNSAPKYEGKTILVCWSHERLPTLAYYLMGGGWRTKPSTVDDRLVDTIFDGIARNHPQMGEPADHEQRITLTQADKQAWREKLLASGPAAKIYTLWPSYDFDSVYVFKTDCGGNYVEGSFAVYPHQYPVDDPQTWDNLVWSKPSRQLRLSYSSNPAPEVYPSRCPAAGTLGSTIWMDRCQIADADLAAYRRS